MIKTSKRTPRWQAAFLRALSQYGNVRLAAEAAEIDKTVCYVRRRKDPAFAAAWDRAKAQAVARLTAAGSAPTAKLLPKPNEPPRGDGRDAGLVVYAGSAFMPPRLQRPRRNGWSAAKEHVFLQRLADTCNVAEAARTIGMTMPSIYKRRSLDSGFERRWREALTNGMLALEAKLIRATCDMLEGNAPPPCYVPDHAPVVDIASAIMLLSEHKKQQTRTKRRGWRPAPLPGIEEVQATVLRKIKAVVYARDRKLAKSRSLKALKTGA